MPVWQIDMEGVATVEEGCRPDEEACMYGDDATLVGYQQGELTQRGVLLSMPHQADSLFVVV